MTAPPPQERPTLASILAPLGRDQLRQILVALADDDCALTARIELQATALQAQPKQRAPALQRLPRPPAVDPNDVRRQVQAAIRGRHRGRSSEAHWRGGGAARQVVAIAEQARVFFEADDVPTALLVLEAATEAYLDVWMEIDDSDTEGAEAFADLDALWAEALLSSELTATERDHWADRLAEWQAGLDDYGVDDAFLMAGTALREGWDDPALGRALRGEAATATPAGSDGAATTLTMPALADLRLRILERQGRTDEYLNLAAAAGRRTAYGQMLLRLGRVAEAVEYGSTLTTPAEALALAQALYGQGSIAEALRLAERGLTLDTPRHRYAAGPPAFEAEDWDEDDSVDETGGELSATEGAPVGDYQRATLARWLRDVAHAQGQPDPALRAAVQVVRDDPSLADYLGVEALAGDAWPTVRETLLAHVRELFTYNAQAKLDIFLHESLWDDAIALAEATPYARELVEQVADAVVASHPGWVIPIARARAHDIIESGSAAHYEAAARWLARWRDASQATGREREWRAYLDDVLERHRRKYKLMPLLRDLDE